MVDILPSGFAQVFTLVVIILVILALHFVFWLRNIDLKEYDEVFIKMLPALWSTFIPVMLFLIISGETPKLWLALVCFGGFALLEWIVLAIKELSICWWLYVYEKEIVDNTLSETERRMVKNLQRYKAVKAETKAEKRERDE